MADIRIRDLPAGGGPVATDFVPIDNGTTRRATIQTIVETGRPVASQAESEAAANNTKVMTPLTVSQAVDFYGLTKNGNLDGLTNVPLAQGNLGLGSAATQPSSAFATSSQGALADTAVQPGDLGNSASRNIGTTAGTVAAGDDTRIVNALQPGAEVTQVDYTDNRPGGTAIPLFNIKRIEGARPEYFPPVGVSGADIGTGVATAAQDNAAFQAALDTGDNVLLGDGKVYKLTGVSMVTGQTIKGSDDLGNGSIIRAAHATNDIVVMNGDDMTVEKVRFETGVTRTSGHLVRMGPTEGTAPAGNYNKLDNVSFYDVPDPVLVNTNNRADLVRCKLFDCDGALVTVVGGFNHQISNIFTLNDPGAQPTYGLYIKAVGDLLLSGAQLLRAGTCVFMDVNAGATIASVEIADSFLDSSVRGLWARSTGTGIITRCNVRGSWLGGHTDQGALIQRSSTGAVDGIKFFGCQIVLNGGDGLATTGTVKNIHVRGGTVAQNAAGSGISWGDGATFVSACPDILGSGDGLNGNLIGLFIGTSVDNYTIAPTSFTGNGTQLSNGSPTAANGKVRAADGFAVLTGGSAGFSAATTAVVNHGLPVAPNDYDIRLNAVQSIAATKMWVSGITATQFTINLDTASTGFVGWNARHPLYRG